MRTDSGASPRLGSTALPERRVVHRGVRHVAIDVLPRTVVTFRTVCGRDVVEDDDTAADVTTCSWCVRVERTWVVAKATDVI